MAEALSGVQVANGFVDRVYAKLTPVYDIVFGPALQAGREAALERMQIQPGDRVLEVGIGTGLTAPLYPRECQVTGIDLSAAMLEKARERLRHHRVRNVRLLQMDAAAMRFDDEGFDVVYAPYTISVVPDPVGVAREMHRVCKPGGRIVFLNHFRSTSRPIALLERAVSPMTIHVGFRADLDLRAFLAQAGLAPASIEKVNVPHIWTLVTCIRDARQTDADSR
jgi:phosphatidylethanolamine/phosphatidyl-N-methylethanolamine N-methyltransferase